MESKFEVEVKYKIKFGVIRNMVNVKLGFKDVYREFIEDIINFVNLRFKRMKLKEELLEVYIRVLEEDIMVGLEVVS